MHLFTFADRDFNGAVFEGSIGAGYTGGKNFDVTSLEAGEAFGRSLSLDANRLATGAISDDGADNLTNQTGAVYLFSFADSAFADPVLEGIIGRGYTGGKNLDITSLDPGDGIGEVSLDANRLAIGSPGDAGFGNTTPAGGAVYLVSFADSQFNGATVEGIIGDGYTGGKNLNLSLIDPSDLFGFQLGLDGNALAVGASFADGFNNTGPVDIGEVHLFTFADSTFSSPSHVGSIGHGYVGAKSFDLSGTLDNLDRFGEAISLDNDRLAIGSPFDDGSGNAAGNSGAVYLFDFSDNAFTAPGLLSTIGVGYSGTDDLDTTNLTGAGDTFGHSVSLDGDRIAIGAPLDDGLNNTGSQIGAVHLLSLLGDTEFDGLEPLGIVGSGYADVSATLGIDLSPVIDDSDGGKDVSLDGTRMAIGAVAGDGAANATSNSGEVLLLTFSDLDFNGALLEGVIGDGYSGGKNIDVDLDNDDFFGRDVSLDGNRLAVGAPQDDGLDNTATDTGAAYLFSFIDSTFSGGVLEATIGKGYTGGKNIDLSAALDDSDLFADSVSLDGNRLAVGAPLDSGAGNVSGGSGAAYLFSFSDGVFSDGVLEATIGEAYTGGKNVDLSATLDGVDLFGNELSLDGNRLVVGATHDDGSGAGGSLDFGAAHLFTFTDSLFAGGVLEGTIGLNYAGPKDINLALLLDNDDRLGQTVSLDGNRLAVGAGNDDGSGAAGALNFGAVHLFSFTDSVFSGGALEASVGEGYTGGKNVDPGLLDSVDTFGASSISLDGNRLAVGAGGDDGIGNTRTNTGAVHLFKFDDTAFNGGELVGTIGAGYTDISSTLGIDLSAVLETDDRLTAVSLDANRLAVGSTRDDGAANSFLDIGAVKLFSFTDSLFNGAVLEATIGAGYTGGKNIDVASLATDDDFGISVSLDGTALAVGAAGDDGFNDGNGGVGAAYLFSFSDTSFNNGNLEAVIGSGYTGAKDIDLGPGGLALIEDADAFGRGVSLDNNRLAVGAFFGDGQANATSSAGEAYLFTFTDNQFSGGQLEGIIGDGFNVRAKDIDISSKLDGNDQFGLQLSLDGNRLAVGAKRDDGQGLAGGSDFGAVHLFTFADASFSGGALVGTVGSGYNTLAADVDIAGILDAGDQFGDGIGFDGNSLAVSAFGDDGFGAAGALDLGTVHLFSFTDSVFTGGTLEGSIGSGYVGAKDLDLSPSLDNNDEFGRSSVALDGTQLAVSARLDDGADNTATDAGTVYLFTFSDTGFNDGVHASNIGSGYTDTVASLGFDVAPALEASDFLGRSVSLDGNRLAIGLAFDDGAAGQVADVGAAFLLSFSDSQFSDATLGS